MPKKTDCDRWFSKAVRERDGWVCQSCYKSFGRNSDILECAHVIGRANKMVRWNPDNAISLCRSCHAIYTCEPKEWEVFCMLHFGANHMEDLKIVARGIGSDSDSHRARVAKHYKNEFFRMVDSGADDLQSYELPC